MTTIASEPRPGTAFKKIVEEQAMMDEFMAMIKKKLEADKRYLDDLIELKSTWNPKWSDTGVWELMSPILAYFTEEISHLTAAQADITVRFTTVQTQERPVSLFYTCEDRMEPLFGIGEALEKSYVDCEGRRQSTSTPEAQRAIARARREIKKIKQDKYWDEYLGVIFPEEDRAYRIAVNAQHRTVSPVNDWYANELPGIVERHQQRAEDIKALLLGYCRILGEVALALSASCSSALHSNQAFASTRFIAPRHDEVERERCHLLLQKFEYRNFFDGRICEPIFGLGPERTLTLVTQILDAMGPSPTGLYLPLTTITSQVDVAFDVEERILSNTDLAVEISHRNRADLRILLRVTLWSDDPLFPILPQFIDEYPNGVPRKKLRQIVDLVSPELRRRVMALLERMGVVSTETYHTYADVAANLCHTRRARVIASEIWRKWDFEGDCPLPDGVTRDPTGKLRTKNGRLYTRDSSSND